MTLDNFGGMAHGELRHKKIDLALGPNTLVGAVEGKRVKVFRWILSSDTAMRFSLCSGKQGIFDFYGLEHFGIPLTSDMDSPIFVTNVGEELILFASETGNANVYVQYKVEE